MYYFLYLLKFNTINTTKAQKQSSIKNRMFLHIIYIGIAIVTFIFTTFMRIIDKISILM